MLLVLQNPKFIAIWEAQQKWSRFSQETRSATSTSSKEPAVVMQNAESQMKRRFKKFSEFSNGLRFRKIRATQQIHMQIMYEKARILILGASLWDVIKWHKMSGYQKPSFFLMWTLFKVFIDSVTILLLFYVLGFFFGLRACGILAPWPGIKSEPPAPEGEVPTGPPGESLSLPSLHWPSKTHTFLRNFQVSFGQRDLGLSSTFPRPSACLFFYLEFNQFCLVLFLLWYILTHT